MDCLLVNYSPLQELRKYYHLVEQEEFLINITNEVGRELLVNNSVYNLYMSYMKDLWKIRTMLAKYNSK